MSSDPRIAAALWRPYIEDIALACHSRMPAEDTALVAAIWARETHFGTCFGYVVPPGLPRWMGRGDGGRGRGLGQIDDRGPFKHLIPADGEEWPPFVQASSTCVVLYAARNLLAQNGYTSLAPRLRDQAVACLYNASPANVLYCLRNGLDPDRVTTPGEHAKRNEATGKRIGDYGSDVLRLRDGLRELYPTIFPPAAAPAPLNVA